MYKFIVKDYKKEQDVILSEEPYAQELSSEYLDYIFDFFKMKYLKWKDHRELIVDNNIIKLFVKGSDFLVADKYLERIADDYNNIIYQCDGENVICISTSIVDAFSSFAKELDNLENEIERKILWASSFEIIYGSVFPYSERESISTMDVYDLDSYKEEILKVTNYNVSNLKIPQNNFDVLKLNNNSFSYIDFITREKKRIIQITQKCDRVDIGHFYYNPRGNGCVFSIGEFTNNIKHCSKNIRKWFEDINKDIENINDIAIKNWNFLE